MKTGRATRAGMGAVVMAIVLYCGAAGAHGRVTLEEDACVRRGGDNSLVHLSVYQPQHEPSDEYCTEIPREGEAFLVVDLVDQVLRDIPVAVRVVRGTHEVEDETVAYLHPSHHPDGVIRGETRLEQGLYTVFITGDAVPPVRYQYPLRVNMVNYAKLLRAAVGPLIMAAILMLLGYRFLRSRQSNA